MNEQAVQFAMTVIARSRDWQEVADAIANHADAESWLGMPADDEDALAEVQSIIHEAEQRLGSKMPADYA